MISRFDHYAPLAQWPFFAPTWTQIRLGFLDAGGPTKCFVIYMSKPTPWLHSLPQPCSTTAILLSSKTNNSLKPAYRRSLGGIGACSTLEWLQILGGQGQPQPKLVTCL
jgi:hypothetical protein